MSGWSFADMWEVVAQQLPDAPAQIQGDRRISWVEFDRRANGVAQALLDAGAQEQDKVAQYLYNCPEYMESVFAAFKAGLAPINTNYRYLDDELVYLWDNGDVVAVVFHGSFVERIENIRLAGGDEVQIGKYRLVFFAGHAGESAGSDTADSTDVVDSADDSGNVGAANGVPL